MKFDNLTAVSSGVLVVTGYTIPEVWENSIGELWENGRDIKTEYDKPGDPPSKDLTAILVVKNPMDEPRIHRSFPAGIDTLFGYVEEVVNGSRDHHVSELNYTYHDRLHNYPGTGKLMKWDQDDEDGEPLVTVDVPKYDQIYVLVQKLKECSYTRRAQAIVWVPERDMQNEHAPCLQRLWFRVVNGRLEMNAHMRSNDAFKAAFMNMFAFTKLQEKVAKLVGVDVGKYTHIADSYHIYGSYYNEVKGFIKQMYSRTFADRTWTTDEAFKLQYESYPMGTLPGELDPDKVNV